MKTKCNKCNERGYIQDTPHSAHSCTCGWAIEQQSKALEGIPFEALLDYGLKRSEEKQKLCSTTL